MTVSGDLTDQTDMTPTEAILIYDSPRGSLATIHPVQPDPSGAPILLPGRNLTHENLKEMTNRLGARARTRLILPPNVLIADQDMVCWWRPSRRWPIFFETRMPDFDADLDMQNVLHPALLFLALPGRLKVMALAENARPEASTPLMRAPYFNLYATGEMCPGSVKMPERPFPILETLAEYEQAFFNSSFVHTNMGSADLTTYEGGHNALWRSLAGGEHTDFPADSLVPLVLYGEPITLEKAAASK